jgi:hypothetical protein
MTDNVVRIAERSHEYPGSKGFDVTILPGDFGAGLCHQGRKCCRHCHAGPDHLEDCHDGDHWPKDDP